MSYQFKLEKFEGPLELLLELIEKEKLSITEFSLAHVTDEYLEHIRNNEGICLDHLSDFLSVAAKLILIKSRALLPMLKLSDEEEEEIKDLTYQLEEYKKFKEVSQKIGKLAKLGNICYSKSGYQGIKAVFYPPENFNLFDFKKHFLNVLAEIPVIEVLQEEVVSEVMTLEDKISDLESIIRQKVETSFSELVSQATDKVEVIVSFLAMLEMVKQRIVDVKQEELFCEIRLKMATN